MGENGRMPSGWVSVKLSNVCDKITDGSHFSPKSVDTGFPYVTVKDLKNDTIDFSKCLKISNKDYIDLLRNDCNPLKNDVLFSKDGTVGKVALINYDFQFVVLSFLAMLRPNSEIISSKYLFYILKSSHFLLQALNQKKGVAIRRIILRDLKEINLNLPPLPEQHRIVAKIEELFSSLDKGIESLKTAQQQLKVYRQAVLKWAFEGKLTNKNVVEGELPKGWTRVKLKELVDKISDGPFGSNLKTSDYVENGVRVIRLENIGYMEFRNEFESFVTKDKYETIKKHTVLKGDIILSSFVAENIRAAILPDFINKAINKADCFLVRPSTNKISNKYLFFYFSTREMYQQLIGEIHGATRPRINTTQLKSCQIPLAPLPEQKAIVSEIESRLSVCDKIEETIEQGLKQSETLRQSILKKAFEGKLVPQDPNDLPANVLLARIKAERENNQVKTPQPRRARKARKSENTDRGK